MAAPTSWPAQSFAIDAKAIAKAYAAVRPALAKDPLFVKDAHEYDVSLADLDARMKKPPKKLDDGDALYEWLDGADQYRYAGLLVLLEAFGGGKTSKLKGPVVVRDDEVRISRGDVLVEGHLAVGARAMVVVLGKLTVTGAVLAPDYDYSLVAAREIECADGATGGELIATKRISAKGTFYFGGNDYSARAPLYEGGVLVDFERGNAFTKVKTKKRLTKWDFDAAKKALGLGADDDLLSGFAKKLAASRRGDVTT